MRISVRTIFTLTLISSKLPIDAEFNFILKGYFFVHHGSSHFEYYGEMRILPVFFTIKNPVFVFFCFE
jgi:hypothetical protein